MLSFFNFKLSSLLITEGRNHTMKNIVLATTVCVKCLLLSRVSSDSSESLAICAASTVCDSHYFILLFLLFFSRFMFVISVATMIGE
jgi:hypothetical protein